MNQLPDTAGLAPAAMPWSGVAPVGRRWYAIIVACLFAALIPETIATTSTSVAKLGRQPFDLLFLMGFYGLADLLIREALIRRRLGWPGLILLGVAFGFVNEGVVAGTWYTVAYAGYLYIGQVDVAWAVALTVFHTFISVIVPIAFVEVLFPRLASVSLLRRRGMVIGTVVFTLVTSLAALAPSYRPYRVSVLALAVLLTLVALRLPPFRSRIASATATPRPWVLRGAGFIASTTFFALILIIPSITLKVAGRHGLAAQLVDMALVLVFSAYLLRKGRIWTSSVDWSPRSALALITGVLAFPSLLVVLPGLWSTGEPLVTVPFLALLCWLDRRLRRHDAARHPTTKFTQCAEVRGGV